MKKSRPLRPTSAIATSRPWSSFGWSIANCSAALWTLVLKLPAKPRSAVITISSVRPASGSSFNSGCAVFSVRVARLLNTRSISFA